MSIKKEIKFYIAYRKLRNSAKQSLRECENMIVIVTDAMFVLNHIAKQIYSWRNCIYPIKNKFVKKLYEMGYCTQLTMQIQKKLCWNCSGTGIDDCFGDDDECYKCDGTGIYDSHYLYRFVFDIHGNIFIWHQPTRLVDWQVALTNTESSEFKEQDVKIQDLNENQIKLNQVLVYEWLIQNGVNKKELPITPGLKYYWQKTTAIGKRKINWYLCYLRYHLNEFKKSFFNSPNHEITESNLPF